MLPENLVAATTRHFKYSVHIFMRKPRIIGNFTFQTINHAKALFFIIATNRDIIKTPAAITFIRRPNTRQKYKSSSLNSRRISMRVGWRVIRNN